MSMYVKLLFWGLLSIAITNCGSSNGGIDGTGNGNDSAKTTSIGVVQNQDNSVTVNGVSYNTNDSDIIIDNEVSSSAELADGQVVVVNGTVNKDGKTGTAAQVIFNTRIRGPITLINQNPKSITVLGQVVALHDDIIFGGTATQFSDLQQTNIVEVSGFTLANGDVSATRIDRVENNNYEVTGSLSSLNEAEQQFSINNLVVDYSQTTTPVLSNGLIVKARGTTFNVQGELIATAVSNVSSLLENAEEQVELEGFITEFNGPDNFAIDGIQITTNLQTVFVGNDRDDLELNTKIEVEGSLNADNVLVAERVFFLVANLTNYPSDAILSSSTETFTWNDVGADEYRVHISAEGQGRFYDQTFDGNTTSVTIDNLPENRATFILFLSTRQGDFWSQKHYLFYGPNTVPSAELTSHSHGDVLPTTSATFTWNAIASADAYRLRVYDYYTRTDYHNDLYTGSIPVTVTNLPDNGADLTVEVWTQHNGWWSRPTAYYNLKSAQLVDNAMLTSHTDGQALTSTTETFTWTDVGAEEYNIQIFSRTAKGWFKYHYNENFSGDTNSVEIGNLPINNPYLRVRLRTLHSGWATENYTFRGAALVPDAELISHSNFDVISSDTETFTWTEIPNAEKYYLSIRSYGPTSNSSRQFFNDDYDSFITSQTIAGLPRNSARFFLKLSTLQQGYWAINTYVLEGSGIIPDAEITSHNHGDLITSSSVTISWDDVAADGYHLTITDRETNPRTIIHNQSYGPDTTSVLIENLPENTDQLYITIHTNHDEWWGNKGIRLRTDIAD